MSRSASHPSARSFARAGALLVLAAAACVVGAAGPASAHDQLISVTPADGSTVASAPASVDLVFAEPAIALGTEILVLGPDGAQVSVGPAVLVDSTVSQPLADVRPAGAYSVQWRVTSEDGHPISGALTFTASTAVAPAVAPVPTPSAGSTPADDPATATATPSSEPTASATPPTAQPDPDDGGSAVPWVVGGSAVALAFAAGAIWWVRRATV